jgi:hypothetical protein
MGNEEEWLFLPACLSIFSNSETKNTEKAQVTG